VNVGATRQDGRDGTFFRVSNTFINPGYQVNTLAADIAIVRTIFPFNFGTRVRPISLGSSNYVSANERVTVSGWGFTQTNGPISTALQTLEMTTISNSLCSTLTQYTDTRGWVTNEKLCTVGMQLDTGICTGDSGSPLILRNTVVGVVSWTVRPCARHPSVFVRVSNHLAWIRENL
jgi:secreted trypsin-like serine protease